MACGFSRRGAARRARRRDPGGPRSATSRSPSRCGTAGAIRFAEEPARRPLPGAQRRRAHRPRPDRAACASTRERGRAGDARALPGRRPDRLRARAPRRGRRDHRVPREARPGRDRHRRDQRRRLRARALGARPDPAGRAVSIEREVFPRLVGNGLYGRRLEGYWMDIGTPERYLQASWDILEGRVETERRRDGRRRACFVDDGAEIDAGADARSRARSSRAGSRGSAAGAPSVSRGRPAGRTAAWARTPRSRGSILAAGVPRRRGRGRRAGRDDRRRARAVAAGAPCGEGARIGPGEASRRRWMPRERAPLETDPRGRPDEPARRRARAARPPARRALAGRVGRGSSRIEAQRPRRLRHGRLGDRRRSSRRAALGDRLSKPLLVVPRLRAALLDAAPTARCSARATRATPRRRSPAYAAAEALGARRFVATTGGALAEAARARRRAGDRPARRPAAARRGRLHVRASPPRSRRWCGAAPPIRTEIDAAAAAPRGAAATPARRAPPRSPTQHRRQRSR